MPEESEKLVAKIQLEYTSGTSVEVAKDSTEWDIGLLYFTNKNLWFINSNKERSQVSFPSIIDVDNIKPRSTKKKTKFTKVLEANHVMNIDYRTSINDQPAIQTIQISAAKEILSAVKSQLQVRIEHKVKTKSGALKLSKSELLRRLAVLLHLNIEEEDQLKYFLGIQDRELVNLMLERNRILQSVT